MKKIFILHGWTYSTEKWKPFVNLLKQKGVEVQMLNVPGLTEKIDKTWDMEDYVEWLRQTLDIYSSSEVKPGTRRYLAKRSREVMSSSRKRGSIPDQVGNDKVVLIGHSNGGRIALNFAIKYPQKLAYLILIDSAGIYHDELSIKIKRLILGRIAKVGKKFSASQKFRNILYKIVGESDYKNANPIMKQTMLNLINSDKSLRLDRVITPTLIIWGDADKITPLSDGKLMSRLIKNSKLDIIDGAKHSPQFTNTKEVADVIITNLSLRASAKQSPI